MASYMEAYESQQTGFGQVLDAILVKLSLAPLATPVTATAVLPPLALSPDQEPQIPAPPCYNGDPSPVMGLVKQCLIQFELQPVQYVSERAKVGYVITHLEGMALEWASPVWEKNSPLI
ncbi:hypothetical protein XELAEV_18029099mg, partial [Xenopus laevis]